MHNPIIPMKPEQLPQQRVYEVLTLPQRPESFHCRAGHGEVPEEAVPKKGPRAAIYLGQVEWAWSPMHNSLECYYLHRGAGTGRFGSDIFLKTGADGNGTRLPVFNTKEYRRSRQRFIY